MGQLEASMNLPFARTSLEIDDGLGTLDVTEAGAPVVQHVVGGLWKEATDVDISLTILVLQAAVEWLHW